MKKENFNEMYVSPEIETIQIKLGSILNESCTENTMEEIIDNCPTHEECFH